MNTDHPCSYTFQHLRRQVRVTMTDPAHDYGTDFKTFHLGLVEETPNPKRAMHLPATALAYICPATWIVHGLDVDVSFTTEIPIGIPNRRRIVISSITIKSRDGVQITPEMLRAIPTRKLLAATLHAGCVKVAYYPAGYRGQSLGVDRPDIVNFGDETITEIISLRATASVTAARSLADVAGSTDKDARLRKVAEIVSDEQSRGDWTRRIVNDFRVTDRSARRLIADARAAGYLPALQPRPKPKGKS
jgi:hypothetical protein